MAVFFDETAHVEREFKFELPRPAGAAPGALPSDAGAEGDLADSPARGQQLCVRLLGWEKVGGDIVWRGARLLAAELLRGAGALRGRRALELGAGSGLLGALAAHLGAHAVITDGDEAELPALQENAARFSDELGLGGSLEAAFLEWGAEAGRAAAEESPALPRGGFGLVLGSDIVYMPEHIPALAESIAFFLADDGQALIANTAVATRTSHPEAKALFLASLRAAGLCVEVESPPDGPAFAEGIWSSTDYLLRIRRHLPGAGPAAAAAPP